MLPDGHDLGPGNLAPETLPPAKTRSRAALAQNVTVVGWVVRNLLAMAEWGDLDVLLIDLPLGTGEPRATVARDGVPLAAGAVEDMGYLLCPACGERTQAFHDGSVPRDRERRRRAAG